MARTFIASDPRSGRTDVIVEVHPELMTGAPEADLEALKHRLHERHVDVGLLVTPAETYFIHDKLVTLEFSKETYETEQLSTEVLFRRIGGGGVAYGDGLYAQTRLWLEAMSRNWRTAVPDEALPLVLHNLVGRLAEAEIDGLNELLWAEAVA